jgi:hypothetical protein
MRRAGPKSRTMMLRRKGLRDAHSS